MTLAHLVGDTRTVHELDTSQHEHGQVGDETRQEGDGAAVPAHRLGRADVDQVVEDSRGEVEQRGSVERSSGELGEVARDLERSATPLSEYIAWRHDEG